MNTNTITVLTIEGTVETHERERDGALQLEELRKYVGDVVDVAKIAFESGWRYEFWVHDEGLLNELPINPIASIFDVMRGGQGLVGPVVVSKTDNAGESYPCSFEEFVGAVGRVLATRLSPEPKFEVHSFDEDEPQA